MLDNLKEQVEETLRINDKVNALLIDAITDEGLEKTLSTRGGRTVLDQLCHLHNVRLMWLEILNKDALKKTKVFGKGENVSKKDLKAALSLSGKLLTEELLKTIDAGKSPKGFKKGLIPFMGYVIAHEAHHRGNIMLTLKQCGVKLDSSLQYGIWDWNKL